MAAPVEDRSFEVDVPAPAPTPIADGTYNRHSLVATTLYWFIHAACLCAFVTDVTSGALVLLAVTYFVRMFGITAGYHRYFAHRTYRTSRVFQGVLAVLGATATQKGPLWWAGLHRRHHRYSDQPGDVHSPKEGFWYSHQGWIFDPRWDETPVDWIRDFARYPELVWINRWHFVPAVALAALCFLIAGLPGLVWGYVVSTVLLWHSTYSINSLAHRFGSRRYETPDTSRNNLWLALITMGEGWHNNHHHYMASTRQGFFWWEVDLTYYVLRALAAVGLVWDLREPPAEVRSGDLGRGRGLPKAA
jgi:stearoyl-CoA desaturase (delta-9 desaturase)